MAAGRSDYDSLIKAALIGNAGVGKSAILLRECENSFSSSFITTIGIDFKVKTMTDAVPGKKIKLQLWDTAGITKQTDPKSYFSGDYRGVRLVFVVYDVADEQSFQDARHFLKRLGEGAGEYTIVLLGNKADLLGDKMVETARGQALADEYEVPFFEVSAKTGANVHDAIVAGMQATYRRLYPLEEKLTIETQAKISLVSKELSDELERKPPNYVSMVTVLNKMRNVISGKPITNTDLRNQVSFRMGRLEDRLFEAVEAKSLPDSVKIQFIDYLEKNKVWDERLLKSSSIAGFAEVFSKFDKLAANPPSNSIIQTIFSGFAKSAAETAHNSLQKRQEFFKQASESVVYEEISAIGVVLNPTRMDVRKPSANDQQKLAELRALPPRVEILKKITPLLSEEQKLKLVEFSAKITTYIEVLSGHIKRAVVSPPEDKKLVSPPAPVALVENKHQALPIEQSLGEIFQEFGSNKLSLGYKTIVLKELAQVDWKREEDRFDKGGLLSQLIDYQEQFLNLKALGQPNRDATELEKEITKGINFLIAHPEKVVGEDKAAQVAGGELSEASGGLPKSEGQHSTYERYEPEGDGEEDENEPGSRPRPPGG